MFVIYFFFVCCSDLIIFFPSLVCADLTVINANGEKKDFIYFRAIENRIRIAKRERYIRNIINFTICASAHIKNRKTNENQMRKKKGV